MGGLVIDTVRPGVQFVPDAAKAFQRAEYQWFQENGERLVDVNSTYRSWDEQMRLHQESLDYAAGRIPYPGHSYATHPKFSRHVAGNALDSDDWVYPRFLQIMLENGFERNQLNVPNENHHFEYNRGLDRNYGKEIYMPLSQKDVDRIANAVAKKLDPEFDEVASQSTMTWIKKEIGGTAGKPTITDQLREIKGLVTPKEPSA